MQMISRNKNGITLITLVVTVIVIAIMVGITLNYGISELNSVSNKKFEIEVSTVQEAVMQRYILVQANNKLGIIAVAINDDVDFNEDTNRVIDSSHPEITNRPKEFVGTRIASSSEISFEDIDYLQNYSSGTENLEYEKYYYALNESDLKKLGIEKGNKKENSENSDSNRYIVNYFTGEVFDIANKKYYKTDDIETEQIYTQPTNVNTINRYDFNDD